MLSKSEVFYRRILQKLFGCGEVKSLTQLLRDAASMRAGWWEGFAIVPARSSRMRPAEGDRGRQGASAASRRPCGQLSIWAIGKCLLLGRLC